MSGTCFESITRALRYTKKEKPSFRDRFHQVRELIVAWNKHMAKVFVPGWISCLNKLMSI